MSIRGAGIVNFGLDLIYALPGQGMGGWMNNLRRAIELSPAHISIYGLSIEEGTLFHREAALGRLDLPSEEMQADMYIAGTELLESAGYARYEISNFAKQGYECRHNASYWSCGDYLGFGAGAHSHISGRRWMNGLSVPGYTKAVQGGEAPAGPPEVLNLDEMRREFFMLGLRRAAGISVAEYEARFGADMMERYGVVTEKLVGGGYLAVDKGNIRLTMKGVLASDAVVREFF